MAWWSTNLVIGGLTGTLLATWFVTGWPAAQWPQLGWRLGAIEPALALGVIASLFSLLVADRPLRSTAAPKDTGGAWLEVISSPALRSIAACYFCLKLMRYSFLFWLPLYMVERLQYGQAEAGYTSSLYELVGFAGVPLAGYLSDYLLGGRRFPVGCSMMFALAAACLAFPQLSASGRIGNLVAIGLVGMQTFGPDTLLAGAATGGGFVNGVGSVGQLISPFLVSTTVRLVGWEGLFGVLVVVAAMGGVALALRWNQEAAPCAAEFSNV